MCVRFFVSLAELFDQVLEKGYPQVETYYDLAMDGKVGPQVVYDPDVDEEEFQLDPYVRESVCGEVSFAYKKEAVKYWLNDGRKRRSFSSVQKSYRKVTQVGCLFCAQV